MDPRFATAADKPRDVIAPGIVCSIFNKHASKKLKKHIYYVTLTKFEFALYDKVFAKFAEVFLASKPPTPITALEMYQCVTGYREKQEVLFRA